MLCIFCWIRLKNWQSLNSLFGNFGSKRFLPLIPLSMHFLIINYSLIHFLFLCGGSFLLFMYCLLSCKLQEGVNILAVNYGSPGSCQYPRQLKFVSFSLQPTLPNSFIIAHNCKYLPWVRPPNIVVLIISQPTKWSFKSHTVLKNSDQAPR